MLEFIALPPPPPPASCLATRWGPQPAWGDGRKKKEGNPEKKKTLALPRMNAQAGQRMISRRE